MNIQLSELLGKNYYSYVAEEKSKYQEANPESIAETARDKDDFIMLPVVDFVFKRLFGDYKRTERLKSLLSSILKIPMEDFEDLVVMNPELPKDFSDDKYGVLDVRVGLKDGKQINIEVQVLPFILMPERSLYYWSKIYTQQLKQGDRYTALKKCITINILDYEFSLANNVHSVYHISEDKTKTYLTDVLEIHFIDLEKLRRGMGIEGLSPSLLKWLRFLAAKKKEEFEMLAKSDKEIDQAYKRLLEISADDKQRMVYEARELWLMDQRTREAEALDKGMAQGMAQGVAQGMAQGMAHGVQRVAMSAIREGMDLALIAKLTGLSEDEIRKLAQE